MTEKALIEGVAQTLAGAGLGDADPERIWTQADADTAIVFGDVPEYPSLLISIDSYTVQDDPHLNDSIVAVKFHLRGTDDSSSVRDLNDAIFGLFQGLHDTAIGGVPVVLMWRQSSIPMGQDDNNRWQRSATYYARVAWPTVNRTD